MPEERPGRSFYCTATKPVAHGAPVTELGRVGQAIKQVAAPAGTGLGSALITTVQIGERFNIRTWGRHYFTNARQEGGTFAKGDPVYIRASDNLLTATDTGNLPFGYVAEVAGERGVGAGKMRVDLDEKPPAA